MFKGKHFTPSNLSTDSHVTQHLPFTFQDEDWTPSNLKVPTDMLHKHYPACFKVRISPHQTWVLTVIMSWPLPCMLKGENFTPSNLECRQTCYTNIALHNPRWEFHSIKPEYRQSCDTTLAIHVSRWGFHPIKPESADRHVTQTLPCIIQGGNFTPSNLSTDSHVTQHLPFTFQDEDWTPSNLKVSTDMLHKHCSACFKVRNSLHQTWECRQTCYTNIALHNPRWEFHSIKPEYRQSCDTTLTIHVSRWGLNPIKPESVDRHVTQTLLCMFQGEKFAPSNLRVSTVMWQDNCPSYFKVRISLRQTWVPTVITLLYMFQGEFSPDQTWLCEWFLTRPLYSIIQGTYFHPFNQIVPTDLHV